MALSLSAAVTLALSSFGEHAQSYPKINLIVPLAPGDATDMAELALTVNVFGNGATLAEVLG